MSAIVKYFRGRDPLKNILQLKPGIPEKMAAFSEKSKMVPSFILDSVGLLWWQESWHFQPMTSTLTLIA